MIIMTITMMMMIMMISICSIIIITYFFEGQILAQVKRSYERGIEDTGSGEEILSLACVKSKLIGAS